MRLFSFRCPSGVSVALKKRTNLLKVVKVAKIDMGRKFQVWQGVGETVKSTLGMNRDMSSVPNIFLVRTAILAMSSKEGSKGAWLCAPD